MFRRRTRGSAAKTEHVLRAADQLRGWAQGIAIGTPVFVVVGTLVRGWQNTGALLLVASIGLLAFLWAHVLVRLSRRADALHRVDALLWANLAILLLLATTMIGVTWASFSPLFWLYLVLIAAESLQDRRRSIVLAWLSWSLFCLLAAAHGTEWLPDELSGIPWNTHPLGAARFFHVVSIALWYLAIAIAISRFHVRLGEREEEFRRGDAELKRREQELLASRETLRSELRAMEQRAFQFEQERRLLHAERERWSRERQQWDFQRTQIEQMLADREVSLAEQAKKLDDER